MRLAGDGAVEWSLLIGCVACVAVAFFGVTACRFTFEEGTLVPAEQKWLARWLPIACAAAAVSVAAFLLEACVYDEAVLMALRLAFAANLAVVCAWSDCKEHIIPNKQVLLALVLAVLVLATQALLETSDVRFLLVEALLGALVGAGIFLLSRIISRGGVGFGDVKLFGALGLLLGLTHLLSVLVYTTFAAFIVAVALLATKKKKMSDKMPLAPFALVGVVVALTFGG